MNSLLLSLCVGCAAGIASIAFIGLALRCFKRIAPVRMFVLGICLSEVVALGYGLLSWDVFHLWPATAAIVSIGIANFFVFSAVYKSVSIQMLLTLASQPDGVADKSVFVDRIVRPSVEGRMELLVEMGLVRKTGEDAYAPTQEGERFVARLAKVQRLFGVTVSGLYGRT